MYIKKLSIAGVFLSALSIIPIAFLCINMNNLLNLQHIGGVDPKVAEALLKRTLSTPIYLWPIISGFLIYSLSATVSAFMLKAKVTGLLKWQSALLLVFGGFGIASILGVIWLIKSKAPKRSRAIRKFGMAGVSLLAVSPIPFIAIAASYEGLDYRTNAKPIQYSTDINNPNLIEIFSDGFDQGHINPILKRYAAEDNQNHFGDFTSFPFTFAQGFLTNISIPPIWGGDQYNPFEVRLLRDNDPDKILSKDTPLDYAYKKTFTQAGVEHMNDIPTSQFGQVSMVNTASMSDSAAYASTVSGDPHNIWKVQKEMADDSKTDSSKPSIDATPYNIVNWGDSKDFLTGPVGSTRYNHDGVFYQWMEKNVETTAPKGARVLMQDFITHTPMTGDMNGKLKWNSGSDKYERVVKTLDDFFNSLPKAVYDNSMIVVYGDHADHSRKSFDIRDKNVFEGNRTFSMVKYPHRSAGKRTAYKDDTSVSVYVPYVRQFAMHYFQNPDLSIDTNELDWIHRNKNFEKYRTFKVYNSNYNEVWDAKIENKNLSDPDSHPVSGEQLYKQGPGKSFAESLDKTTGEYDSGMGWV